MQCVCACCAGKQMVSGYWGELLPGSKQAWVVMRMGRRRGRRIRMRSMRRRRRIKIRIVIMGRKRGKITWFKTV